MHQIRIHMQHIGYPLAGDALYVRPRTKIARQALHCEGNVHPVSGRPVCLESLLPEDMRTLLASFAN